MLDRFRSKLPRKLRHSAVWEKPSKRAQERLAYDQQLVWQGQKKKRIPSWRQLRYISSFFTARERFLVLVSFGFIFAGLTLGSAIGYAKLVEEVPAQGGSYREGLLGSPLYVNPILANTSDVDLDLSSLIFSGLLRYDKELEFQPDLAQSWEISEDGKTYTVVLRSGLQWHDGAPLTVDDVLFTYRAIQEPAVNSPLQSALRDVQITKSDNLTIQFVLPEPFYPFVSVLTTGIIPQHLWANLPANNIRLAELNIKPIGSGPWKFEKLEKDKFGSIHTYTLVPFEAYHLQKPFLSELTFQFFSDFGSAIEALNTGKIQGISYLPQQLLASVGQGQRSNVHQMQLPQYTAVFFNTANNSALASKQVRSALAQSIDRERLIREGLNGNGRLVNGPLLEGMNGFDPSATGYSFDPVLAQQQLTQAGWEAIDEEAFVRLEQERLTAETDTDEQETDHNASLQELVDQGLIDTGNQAVFRAKDGEILRVRLTTVDQPENVRAAELIRSAWQAAGVKVDVEIVPVSVLLTNILPARDYEALLYGQILNVPADLYAFWHSSQIESPGLNLALYADKDTDEWLEQARISVDEQSQADLYRLVETRLREDIPAIFLFTPRYNYLLPDTIKGFDVERLRIPADRFKNLQEWYSKTKRIIAR